MVLVAQIKSVRAAALGINRKNIYRLSKLAKKAEMLKEDVATRQVLAAQVGKYHDSQLVLTTLKQACLKATPQIFHCDQGTEFMAKVSTDYLEKIGGW